MKVYRLFKVIHALISNDKAFKLVTWYNNQLSEGTIHTTPAVYIQFAGDLKPETLHFQLQQAPITLRVFLVNKLFSKTDGSIDTNILQTTEDLAESIYYSLQGFDSMMYNGDIMINSLQRTNYTIDMDNPGWIIITQDFECMIYQPEQAKDTVKVTGVKITV